MAANDQAITSPTTDHDAPELMRYLLPFTVNPGDVVKPPDFELRNTDGKLVATMRVTAFHIERQHSGDWVVVTGMEKVDTPDDRMKRSDPTSGGNA